MKEEKFPHTRTPLHWWRWGVGRGGSFGATEESAATGVQRAKQRDSHTEISAEQHSPAREACLLTRRGGRGLGAEARASEVRPQREDWGWLGEHSLKGASVPQIARRESGENSGPSAKARDLCFRVCEERGFLPSVPTEGRALPKRAPEMGMSCGYHLEPQRQA